MVEHGTGMAARRVFEPGSAQYDVVYNFSSLLRRMCPCNMSVKMELLRRVACLLYCRIFTHPWKYNLPICSPSDLPLTTTEDLSRLMVTVRHMPAGDVSASKICSKKCILSRLSQKQEHSTLQWDVAYTATNRYVESCVGNALLQMCFEQHFIHFWWGKADRTSALEKTAHSFSQFIQCRCRTWEPPAICCCKCTSQDKSKTFEMPFISLFYSPFLSSTPTIDWGFLTLTKPCVGIWCYTSGGTERAKGATWWLY